MKNCKDCRLYIGNENEKKGTCAIMGNSEMIKENSTITDNSEEDFHPYHVEVGENFGCIHHVSK
jgi:hypothetical protein